MSWEVREILLVVKTYPAKSQKYGSTVCTAGILEDTEEWIRIYPIRWLTFRKTNLKKFIRFKAKVKKDTSDYLKRKESHKIQEDSIKITDDSLINTSKKGVWEKRTNILIKVMSETAEDLNNKFEEDRTSLGIIKPKLNTVNFRLRKDINNIEIHREATTQYDLFGEKLNRIDEIEKAFSYKFKCESSSCKGHDRICEDWEIIQAFRSWKKKYPNNQILEEKLSEKFQDWMTNRDLHFVMGTHWRFPKWIIIGLYYPPQKDKKKKHSSVLVL